MSVAACLLHPERGGQRIRLRKYTAIYRSAAWCWIMAGVPHGWSWKVACQEPSVCDVYTFQVPRVYGSKWPFNPCYCQLESLRAYFMLSVQVHSEAARRGSGNQMRTMASMHLPTLAHKRPQECQGE